MNFFNSTKNKYICLKYGFRYFDVEKKNYILFTTIKVSVQQNLSFFDHPNGNERKFCSYYAMHFQFIKAQGMQTFI